MVVSQAIAAPVSTDLQRAFESAYGAYHANVLAYALRRVDGRPAAEDVAAETFAVAWRRRDAMPADPLTWLYGIARRVVANHHRSGRRRQSLFERVASATEYGSSTRPTEDQTDKSESLAAAFQLLPLAHQEALALIAWEELSPDEAAAVMGCSPATFRVRLHRARRAMSKNLRDARTHPKLDGQANATTPSKPEEAR